MFCYQCSAQIENGEVFCRNCGTEAVAVTAVESAARLLPLVGNFLLGAALFVVALIVLITLRSFLGPANPQFTIAILFALGIIVSGALMVVLKKNKRTRKRPEKLAKRPRELDVPDVRRLPDERFSGVPISVTESTTNELMGGPNRTKKIEEWNHR